MPAETPEGLIARTPMDEKLARLLEPSVAAMGFALVRVRLKGGGSPTLQVMAERPDGTMDVDDCAELSHALSATLDVEDPIEGAYALEVSSPGLDRPLTRRVDFTRWAGHEAKLELAVAVEGRKRFRGVLAGFDAEADTVLIDAAEGGRSALPFRDLGDAKLILTDALVAESLKRGKAAAAAGGAAAEGAEMTVSDEAEAADSDADDANTESAGR